MTYIDRRYKIYKENFWKAVKEEYDPNTVVGVGICLTSKSFEKQWNKNWDIRERLRSLAKDHLESIGQEYHYGSTLIFRIKLPWELPENYKLAIHMRNRFIDWCIDKFTLD